MTAHPYDYDYFVIGAGSGGVRSARIAAGHGAKVGIAESTYFGGTCVNVGCVPKKLLSFAADYAHDFKDSEGYGWSGHGPQFDWSTLIRNKNAEIERLNGIYGDLLKNAGVTVHWGFATFKDNHTIDIDGQTLTADKILIATGGSPRRLDIPGGEYAITSDEAFFLETLPDSILIVGGGYIAVEFAKIFSGLGVTVTLIYRGQLFLRGFDKDIRLFLVKEMEKQSITLVFEDDMKRIEKEESGYTVITAGGQTIQTGLVMAAIGRDPATVSLNLEKAGVERTATGRIPTNEHFQTNIPHIFAVGDITNDYHLTPVALTEGHALADNLFGPGPDRFVSYDNIATAIFSGPPIATIGLSEEEARARGIEITCFKANFRGMKFVMAQRDERSLMKLIVEKATDKVIGCHMIGHDAPEIIQGFAVAMNCGATKADFDRTIGVHPTVAEEFVTMRTPVDED